MSKTESKQEFNLAGIIVSWILAILFISIGVFSLLNFSPIPSAIMFILAVGILPPVTKMLHTHYDYHLSGRTKLIMILVGFLAFSLSIKKADLDRLKFSNKMAEIEQLEDAEPALETPEFTIEEPEEIEVEEVTPEPVEETAPVIVENTGTEPTEEELNVIKADCEELWGTDFKMQAFCREKQVEAVAQWNVMAKPAHVSQENYDAVRKDCIDLWGSDFKMRVFCAGKQFDALLTL